MAIDFSKFPEMKTFSSVIRYSLCMEEAVEEFYRSAAECVPSAAEDLNALADVHKKRYRLLEETRQQKLNEMILEPVCGLDREAYLPDVEITDNSGVLDKAIAVEESCETFYLALTETAKELSREASKVYKQMAKENGKLKNKVQGLK